MSTTQSTTKLRQQYIDLHRLFNSKHATRKQKMACIPQAEALRRELARRSALVTLEELNLALCDPIGDDAA